MAIAGTIAKLALVLLLILPSMDSRAVGSPQSKNVDDAPTDVSNHQNLASQLQSGRGANAVMIPQPSKNNTDSVQGWCNDSCNDQNCRFWYPDLCDGQDPNNCYVGCYCEEFPYRCYCLCRA